jgi:hypothetical protein
MSEAISYPTEAENKDLLESDMLNAVINLQKYQAEYVTPGFKVKSNAHTICAQKSSLHTYRIENGYRITNVTIYNICY